MKKLLILSALLMSVSSAFAARPEDNFLRLLSGWSGVSTDQLRAEGIDQSLYAPYVEGHAGSSKLNITFLQALQQDEFYKSCPAVNSISNGEFLCQQGHGFLVGSFYYPVKGLKYDDDGCGDLMTLRQLYIRLSNCQ